MLLKLFRHDTDTSICSYSHHGPGKEALAFQEMLPAEEYPDYATFIAVLSALPSRSRKRFLLTEPKEKE